MSTDGCRAAAPRAHALATASVHAGAEPHGATGARAVPIFQTNGFVFDNLEHGSDIFAVKRTGFSYSRGSNPTTAALERRVAALEGGAQAIAVASGQSALLLILATLCGSGDGFVASRRAFGGSLGLLKRMASRFGLEARFADPTADSVEAAVTPRTRAILIENVVNPTGEIVDVEAVAAVARRHRVPLVVDSTLATPALQTPAALGADIVWHSASKFLSGSGTAIGGVIVDAGRFDWAGDERFPLVSRPWAEYDDLDLPASQPRTAFATACRLTGLREFGPGLAPTTAFLILMGVETLPLRMARHCANARRVAAWLAAHPAVADVTHPSLPHRADHALAQRLMPHGEGSIFLATLKGGRAAAASALERLELWSHLVNVGETRSLVCHPRSTTHRQMSEEDRVVLGIEDGTLRLSVGLEDVDDLLADLDRALRP